MPKYEFVGRRFFEDSTGRLEIREEFTHQDDRKAKIKANKLYPAKDFSRRELRRLVDVPLGTFGT
ncbi:MAG TPA: hypothetical protein VJC12_02830 [Candidatus Paceibacterota bacterium]